MTAAGFRFIVLGSAKTMTASKLYDELTGDQAENKRYNHETISLDSTSTDFTNCKFHFLLNCLVILGQASYFYTYAATMPSGRG